MQEEGEEEENKQEKVFSYIFRYFSCACNFQKKMKSFIDSIPRCEM